MNLKSFAKINLSLNINKRLKIGLHEIQSHFCLVDLFDPIKIKKNKKSKDEVKFSGIFSKLISKKNNSVIQTLRILRKNRLINHFYSVKIKKYIPVFAGLGGGTSNAFYLTKYLLKNRVSKKIIKAMTDEIGTDYFLFFHNQGFLKNLNQTKKLRKKYKLFLLLVYPNIRCSTKDIYSKVKNYSPRQRLNLNTMKSKKKYIDILSKVKNDLQPIIEKKHPIIRKLLYEIKQTKGCYFSRVTGSGSVCYGVFQSKKEVIIAQNKIKSKYPNYWSTFVKTI